VRKLEYVLIFTLLLLATGAGQSFLGDTRKTIADEGQPVLQIAFGVLYLALLLLLVFRFRGPALRTIRNDKWTIALCLWAVASTAWSVDPLETLRRSLALIGTFLAGLYLALRFEPREQLRLMSLAVGLGAVASIVVAVVAPGVGTNSEGAWVGIYLIKNTLGRMMALGALCYALLALSERRHRLFRGGMFLLCCVLLVMSKSATAVVVTMLILALLPMRKLLYLRPRRLIAASALLLPVIAGFLFYAVEYSDEILQSLGRTSSLTGRVPLWRLVLVEISDRPIRGWGFTAFWSSLEGHKVSDTVNWDLAVPHAHNGFLELWLGLGIVGLGMMLISMMVNTSRAIRIARANPQPEYSWPLLMMAFTILYNLTESSLLGVNSMPWMAFGAVGFWLARVSREDAIDNETFAAEHAYSN
jgi:exopolysaccharide production protein ExoQ